MSKINIVFCGTPDFSVPSLELLFNHPDVNLLSVVTMPDRPSGRGNHLKSPPVALYARENKIPLIQTENINKESSFLQSIKEKNVDAIVVIAFAQFLSEKLLQLPSLGCFNIHTSLLPKYRGAAPIQYAILNGDKETGITIQRMVKEMDAGDIAKQKSIDISDNETGGQLYTRLKFHSALLLSDFISDLKSNQIQYIIQDSSKVSFSPTLKREDGQLLFSQDSAFNIYNRVRAFFPWPATYCFLNKKRLKVLEAKIENLKLQPGEVSTKFNSLVVGTTKGSIRLSKVQLEGKKVCTDNELLNGLKNSDIIIEENI